MEEAHPVPEASEAHWQRRFLDLQDFICQSGRLPTPQTSDPAERRLHRWLQRQRQRAITATLPLDLADQLQSFVPDFPTPKQILARPWILQYNDLAAFWDAA